MPNELRYEQEYRYTSSTSEHADLQTHRETDWLREDWIQGCTPNGRGNKGSA